MENTKRNEEGRRYFETVIGDYLVEGYTDGDVVICAEEQFNIYLEPDHVGAISTAFDGLKKDERNWGLGGNCMGRNLAISHRADDNMYIIKSKKSGETLTVEFSESEMSHFVTVAIGIVNEFERRKREQNEEVFS